MKINCIFKKVSAVFLSTCMMIAAFAVSSRTANAENTNTGSIEFYEPTDIYNYPIYLDKVRDLQTNGVYNYYDNGFFLCDINNDDMPELFVTYNTNEKGILFAGSIYNDELVTFEEMLGAGGLRSITLYDNGYIGFGRAMQSMYGISIQSYNGGTSLTDVIYVYQDLASKTYTKYVNNKNYTITEAEYNSILNQYTEASYEVYPIPMPYIQGGVTYNNYFNYYEASEYNGSATTLTIPSTVNGLPVTSLGQYLLRYTSTVETLNIPASIESYYYNAFNCDTLETINVDTSNPYWISKNGILYSKDMTILVKYPSAKDTSTYAIPSSVTDIYKYAFSWCSKLKQITLPEAVNAVWDDAFSWCPNLSSVTILNPDCYIEYADTTICNSKTDGVGQYLGVIRGYEGSTAQKFADYYDITFISLGEDPSKVTTTTIAKTTTTITTTTVNSTEPPVYSYNLGDVNGDEVIDASDASLVLEEYSLISTGQSGKFSDNVKKSADLNKDETIDSSDSSLILAYYSYISTGGTNTIERWLNSLT